MENLMGAGNLGLKSSEWSEISDNLMWDQKICEFLRRMYENRKPSFFSWWSYRSGYEEKILGKEIKNAYDIKRELTKCSYKKTSVFGAGKSKKMRDLCLELYTNENTLEKYQQE